MIATDKKFTSPLIDESAVEQIQMYTDSVGVVYSGLGPDSRVLVRMGQKKAAKYRLQYGVRAPPLPRPSPLPQAPLPSHPHSSPGSLSLAVHPAAPCLLQETIPVLQLTREMAAVMQEFTQSGGVRPFGVSLLIGGVDDDGPQLYQVDPSGAYFGWKATAIGHNFANAKTFLEKRYSEEMELEDAIHTALLTLREGFEGEMTKDNIEVGIIGEDRKFRVLTPAEIQDYFAEAE